MTTQTEAVETSRDEILDANRAPWSVRGDLIVRSRPVHGGEHAQEVPHHGRHLHPAVVAAASLGVTHRRMAEVVAWAMTGHDRWLVRRAAPHHDEIHETADRTGDSGYRLEGVIRGAGRDGSWDVEPVPYARPGIGMRS